MAAWATLWVAGVLCLAFGQGHYPGPLLPVIGIACWVLFTRRAPLWLGLLLVAAGNVIVWEIAYRGMVPLPTAARLGMEAGVSLGLGLLFLCDAAAYRSGQSRPWVSMLVLPGGWVAFELLSARLSPGATWSSLAYNFVDHPSVSQIASVTGWTGVTFFVSWCAVLAAEAVMRRRVQPLAVAAAVAALLAVVSAAVMPQSLSSGTQVSLLVVPDTYHAGPHLNEVWAYTRGVPIEPEEMTAAQDQIARSREQCMSLVRAEAEAGSRLIVWAEANVSVTAAEEPHWIAAAAVIARDFDCCVGMGMSVFHPGDDPPSENKFVLVAPDGTVPLDFLKRTRPPGASHAVGVGALPSVSLPIGTVSCAICFDMDFPHVITSAPDEVDAILAPSNDWPEVAQTHARMARMRGIENGCWVIRPTKDGVSTVADPFGRQVAAQLTAGLANTDHAVLRTRIAPESRFPIYKRIGDTFAWLCTALWAGLVGATAVNRFRRGQPSA